MSTGVYNPFLEESESKYAEIKFALTWHARSLILRVVAAETMCWHYGKPPEEADQELLISVGDVVQTLLSQTGFVPAGKYEASWDGWMVRDEASGSGHYAPDGKYYIELRTERYSTGEAFTYRSDSGMDHIMQSGSLGLIQIQQDRDAVYSSDPFSVQVTPSGTWQNPPVIYDWETNDGQGIRFDVELKCPARLSIHIPFRLITLLGSETPYSLEDKEFPAERAMIEFRPDSTGILDPGTYLFHFKPALHTKIGMIPRSFYDLPELVEHADLQDHWWVCWWYDLTKAFFFQDLSGKREFVEPSTPCFIWGGQYDGQFNAIHIHDKERYYTFFKIK